MPISFPTRNDINQTYNKNNALALHPDSDEAEQAEHDDDGARGNQESRDGEELVRGQELDVVGPRYLPVCTHHHHRDPHYLVRYETEMFNTTSKL